MVGSNYNIVMQKNEAWIHVAICICCFLPQFWSDTVMQEMQSICGFTNNQPKYLYNTIALITYFKIMYEFSMEVLCLNSIQYMFMYHVHYRCFPYYFDIIYNLTPSSQQYKKAAQIVHEFSMDIITKRRKKLEEKVNKVI